MLLAALAASAVAVHDYTPFRVGQRTLVVHQDDQPEATFSSFFKDLRARGHSLTLEQSTRKVQLKHYGQHLYDNIVVLSPSASDVAGNDAATLATFVDEGGNLLVAGAPGMSTELRKLAHELGVDYDLTSSKARVIDHFSYDASDSSGQHTRVLTSSYFPSEHVVGPKLAAAAGAHTTSGNFVVYEGIGMSVSLDNILAVRALTASPTGYSANPSEPIKKFPQSIGADTVLVASIQARNNARATFTGSLWMFTDAAFGMELQRKGAVQASAGPAANAEFLSRVSAWTFQEAGVLHAGPIRHTRADGTPPENKVSHAETKDLPVSMYIEPEVAKVSHVYRVNDDVVVALDIAIADPATNGTKPFSANDVQLEFVMLDPYVRATMKDEGNGRFTAAFKVPDVYGVFHFRVMYRRPGLTTLYLRDQVTVRPFHHDEYERFIPMAYPYYASAFAMMAAIFVFSVLFLQASPHAAPTKATKAD